MAISSTCISASPAKMPTKSPMRIYPAPHYTMGGLWVDYNLMSTIPGLFVIGEANFADHGANRLGASSLMQGLADGYFILPYTIGHYLATTKSSPIGPGSSRCRARVMERVTSRVSAPAARTGEVKRLPHFTAKLGRLLWDHCGMARHEAGTQTGAESIPAIAGRILAGCGGSGIGRDLQSRTGICRTSRGLSRIRRTALP